MKRHGLVRPPPAARMCTRPGGPAALVVGHPANGRRSAVPTHTEVPDPLARKICRDLGIPDP